MHCSVPPHSIDTAATANAFKGVYRTTAEHCRQGAPATGNRVDLEAAAAAVEKKRQRKDQDMPPGYQSGRRRFSRAYEKQLLRRLHVDGVVTIPSLVPVEVCRLLNIEAHRDVAASLGNPPHRGGNKGLDEDTGKGKDGTTGNKGGTSTGGGGDEDDNTRESSREGGTAATPPREGSVRQRWLRKETPAAVSAIDGQSMHPNESPYGAAISGVLALIHGVLETALATSDRDIEESLGEDGGDDTGSGGDDGDAELSLNAALDAESKAAAEGKESSSLRSQGAAQVQRRTRVASSASSASSAVDRRSTKLRVVVVREDVLQNLSEDHSTLESMVSERHRFRMDSLKRMKKMYAEQQDSKLTSVVDRIAGSTSRRHLMRVQIGYKRISQSPPTAAAAYLQSPSWRGIAQSSVVHDDFNDDNGQDSPAMFSPRRQ